MSGKTPECFARWGFQRPGAAEVGACVGCPEGHKCMHATLMGIFSRMVWEARVLAWAKKNGIELEV